MEVPNLGRISGNGDGDGVADDDLRWIQNFCSPLTRSVGIPLIGVRDSGSSAGLSGGIKVRSYGAGLHDRCRFLVRDFSRNVLIADASSDRLGPSIGLSGGMFSHCSSTVSRVTER